MKPTKRFLSVLLSLCLVLGMLPGVAFAANNYSQFTDVNTSDWYNEAVQYVSGQGLMSGTSATTFEPDASTTRGMIATILYRLEGSPAYLNSGYTDVPANEWYAPAVSWAKTYNVVSGYGDGKFGPNDAISREQLASILFRYSQLKKYDTAMYGDLTKYSDQGKISSYAKIPLSWAVGKGVITGIGDGTLDPQGGATRAQVAAILQRYMDNVVAKGNPLTPGSNVGFAPLPAEPEETAPATYTVTFLMNDGTGKVYNEQVVKAGSKAVKPETPRLQDRTFYGWFLTSNATGRAFDFNSVINSDVTLYADWGGHNTYWRPTVTNPGVSNINLDTLAIQLEENGLYYTNAHMPVVPKDDPDGKFFLVYRGVEGLGNLTANYKVNEVQAGTATLTPNEEALDGDETYTAEINTSIANAGDVVTFDVVIKGQTQTIVVTFIDSNALAAATKTKMAAIDTSIQNVVQSVDGKTDAEKANTIQPVLKALEDANEIKNLEPHPEYQIFTFEYPQNILGAVYYGEYETCDGDYTLNGANESTAPERAELPDSNEIFDDIGDNVPVLFANTVAENEVETLGDAKAIILNSFPEFETDSDGYAYRTVFYEGVQSAWNAAGLDTTLDIHPTVADYRNLDQYNVICISTHGREYPFAGGALPVISLGETATADTDDAYAEELTNHQIVKTNGNTYWILPSFFNAKYGANNDLADSFIFSECCEALGRGQGSNSSSYNYAMANAFLNCGAKGYVGFHNSVFADYSRDIMKLYVDGLIEGKTSQVSYDAAIAAMGANHEIWYNTHFSDTLQQFEIKKTGAYQPAFHIAYPVRLGDANATLVNTGLQNGSFESYNMITTRPSRWEYLGDVRVVSTIKGHVNPQAGSRMAVVTTGLGSSHSNNVSFGNGTEGSALWQTFTLPADAKTITFRYNYISEEPMEFVGSSFNDTFAVQIDQGGATVYDKKLETVNTSEWHAVPNGANGYSIIDFYGGDHTTYETYWKTATIDVSQWAGKTITLRFLTYDMGDEIYDSAAAIDAVMVNK